MGRSNNQRRRTAKATNGTFIPAWTKSKTKNRANATRIQSMGKPSGGKKLAYSKMVNRDGKVVQRKFRAGGYNRSGKLGSARASKNAKKKNGGKS
jgi:hypothetical protein